MLSHPVQTAWRLDPKISTAASKTPYNSKYGADDGKNYLENCLEYFEETLSYRGSRFFEFITFEIVFSIVHFIFNGFDIYIFTTHFKFLGCGFGLWRYQPRQQIYRNKIPRCENKQNNQYYPYQRNVHIEIGCKSCTYATQKLMLGIAVKFLRFSGCFFGLGLRIFLICFFVNKLVGLPITSMISPTSSTVITFLFFCIFSVKSSAIRASMSFIMSAFSASDLKCNTYLCQVRLQ